MNALVMSKGKLVTGKYVYLYHPHTFLQVHVSQAFCQCGFFVTKEPLCERPANGQFT